VSRRRDIVNALACAAGIAAADDHTRCDNAVRLAVIMMNVRQILAGTPSITG